MINDVFANSVSSLTSPAEDCFVIEPHDTNSLPKVTKAIFVGQGGDIRLMPLRGSSAVTFFNLAPGSVLDVRARAVLATGTTALDMVGLI